MISAVGKCRPGFFMPVFPVNHQAVIFFTELLSTLPYLLHKWACGVVLIRINTNFLQQFLNFNGGSKSWNNHNIFRTKRRDWNAFSPIGIK